MALGLYAVPSIGIQPPRVKSSTVANYLLIASTLRPYEGRPISGPAVYDLMMKHKCWEVIEAPPHFKKMRPGDTLAFYLGGQPARYIAGEAVIAGNPVRITKDSPVTFDRNQVPYFRWRIPLQDIVRYEPGRVGLNIVERLSFAQNSPVGRRYLGLQLRNGCRPLSDEDLVRLRAACMTAGSQLSEALGSLEHSDSLSPNS